MLKKPTKNSGQLNFFLKQITSAKNLLTPQDLVEERELTIKEILTQTKVLNQPKSLRVSGWVQSVRQNKFVEIKDGSTLKTLQLVGSPELTNHLKKVKFGSYLRARGQLVLTPHQAQSCELKIEKITSLHSPDPDYPLQKQKIPLEVVRNYPHLRAKTNYFLVLFRLRHIISKALHDFFHQEGFCYVPTPLITSNDTEGAGATFNLTTKSRESFFSKPAQLTVSGQLHAEALAQGLGKVYTFAPCFRAEKSHTTRHLAEFWMIEAELVAEKLETVMKLTERLIKFVIDIVLAEYLDELDWLEKYSQKEIISKLHQIAETDFIRLEYTEVIKLLKASKEKFVFADIKWGMDLKAEHEKFLCRHYYKDRPIFITDYPRDLKAFYMKDRRGQKTVDCFDLIFPEIGELVGGSMRESDYEILKTKTEKVGIDTQDLAWYLDLRRLGYAPSGGFGLGLERLIMLISCTENIQDTLAFPNFHKHLEF